MGNIDGQASQRAANVWRPRQPSLTLPRVAGVCFRSMAQWPDFPNLSGESDELIGQVLWREVSEQLTVRPA